MRMHHGLAVLCGLLAFSCRIAAGIEADGGQNPSGLPSSAPSHSPGIAPFPPTETVSISLSTTHGDLQCSLYAGTHPLTVLNFLSLISGTPAWTDASGVSHKTPYYDGLAFGRREKGAYVLSGERSEGTGFRIPDERCDVHGPTAGAIAMYAQYPGQASAQFMLLARDIEIFTGMYAVFGECAPLAVIEKLTRKGGVLLRATAEKPQ